MEEKSWRRFRGRWSDKVKCSWRILGPLEVTVICLWPGSPFSRCRPRGGQWYQPEGYNYSEPGSLTSCFPLLATSSQQPIVHSNSHPRKALSKPCYYPLKSMVQYSWTRLIVLLLYHSDVTILLPLTKTLETTALLLVLKLILRYRHQPLKSGYQRCSCTIDMDINRLWWKAEADNSSITLV